MQLSSSVEDAPENSGNAHPRIYQGLQIVRDFLEHMDGYSAIADVESQNRVSCRLVDGADHSAGSNRLAVINSRGKVIYRCFKGRRQFAAG